MFSLTLRYRLDSVSKLGLLNNKYCQTPVHKIDQKISCLYPSGPHCYHRETKLLETDVR